MAQPRQFATPTYLVAFTLILIPILDVMMQVIPFRLQDPKWRLGFFVLITNGFMVPLLGLLIAFTAAMLFDQRMLQRVLGILCVITGAVILGLFVIFALDALQLHNDVKPGAQTAFRVASLMAGTKGLLSIVTLSAFGLAGIRGARAPRRSVSTGVPVMVTSVRPSAAIPARPPASAGSESVSAPSD